MNVLLVYPQLGNAYWFGVYEPLALEIFSAIAKEEGCRVRLIDLRFDKKGLERLAREGFVPDIIGTTTHGFTEVKIVNELSARLRRLWPSAAIVVGGIPATLRPDFLDQTNLDLIVRGPGERLWREYCRNGVARTGVCRVVEDPRPPKEFSFPLPDRQITAQYRKHYRTYIPNHTGKPFGRTGFTMLTQGCPFRCSFCVIWPANLGLYRKRKIAEIVAELKTMPEDFVYFGDDNSFVDEKFAMDLADAVEKAGIRKNYSSYSRVDHICKHPEVLRRWHKIGLRYLVLGVEAISNEKLKDFNKRTTHEQNVEAFRILREIGIYAIPHMLISQDMTHKDFDDMYRFVDEHKFEYPTLVPLTPLPGTELYDEVEKQGKLLTRDLRFYNFMFNIVKPKHMNGEEFSKAWVRLHFRVWSWRRWLRGGCGDISFLAFLQWWAFVRLLSVQLWWKRKKMERIKGGDDLPEKVLKASSSRNEPQLKTAPKEEVVSSHIV